MELIQGNMVSTSERIIKYCADGPVFAEEADPASAQGCFRVVKNLAKFCCKKENFM